MIEWLIGAAVFGLVGELFGASRRPSSAPSYQPVFAVGDDWQSIYRFAGADIQIMRSFGPKFGGEFGTQKDVHQVVDLGRTFRSVDKIALAARRFILQNPAQIEKTIIPAGEAEGPALRVVWTKKQSKRLNSSRP